jgi:hypothetical protein
VATNSGSSWSWFFAGGAWLSAGAQDTRHVEEPKIPAARVRIEAKLKAIDDKVAPAEESKLDTDMKIRTIREIGFRITRGLRFAI